MADVLDDRRFALTLGLASTLGIATTSLVLVAAARREIGSFSWRFAPRDPAVQRLVKLSTWTFGYVVVNQIALVVVQNLTEPGSGGRSAYAQAFTFFVLPHGLLAVSIATTFGPELARAVSRGRHDEFAATMSMGVRLVAMRTFPAGIGTAILSRPLVGAFLQHGDFDADDAAVTAQVLASFSVGLVAFSVYLFVLRGFYARLDTRTPFVINAFEYTLNIVLAFALVGRFGVPGLAAAFAGAYIVSSGVALVVLGRRAPGFALGPIMTSLVRFAVASLAMAASVWLVGSVTDAVSGIGAAVRLAASVPIGIATYLIALWVLRATELESARRRFGGIADRLSRERS